ncbi:MAG TPA: FxDxF family PEP-CTERM protein [Burkholderiaceae bacterium]|nr:FxDxF family PEP-CTERM protein [Burkholderiaceae bacterium]
MKLKPIALSALLALASASGFAQSFSSGTTGSFSYLVDEGASLTASVTSVITAGLGFDIDSVLFGSTPFAFTSTAVGGSTFEQYTFSAASLAAGLYTIYVTGTGTAGSAYTGNVVITSPVPEPETSALMFAGLGAIGFMTSRRQRVP